MANNKQFKDISNFLGDNGENERLAKWLKETLPITTTPSANKEPITSNDEDELDNQFEANYHPHFYQQLPDFVIAVLEDDPQVNTRYAPLLYHLLICPTCREAYTEIADPIKAAWEAKEEQPSVSQELHLVEPPPDRVVVYLCKVLISQAEAVLRQTRRDHSDGSSLARSLLQQALQISGKIAQHGVRNQALEDLVRVATIFDGTDAPTTSAGHSPYSYSFSLVSASGIRKGKTKGADATLRHPEIPAEQSAIYLQSTHLDGNVTQHEDTLELHLENLDEELIGQYLLISIPLGSLFEPIRWFGGNPHAIRSVTPVAEDGTLTTPIGETTLRISNPEERNQLEVTFWRLDVRLAG